MNLVYYVGLTVIVAVTTSCGGQPLSNQDEAARLREYQNSFTESFWSKADFSMQSTYSITFQKTREATLADIETFGIDYSHPASKRTFYYDNLNRYHKSESVVYYNNSLPIAFPEGRTDYVVEYFYNSADETMTDQFSQKYWDLKTGYLKQKYFWTGTDFERDIATKVTEKLTNFDPNNDLQAITSTSNSGFLRHFNHQGLISSEERDRDNNLENGYEQFTTYERDTDGKLKSSFGLTSNTVNAYEYDSRGVPSQLSRYSSDPDRPDIKENYYFTSIENRKVVIVELEQRKGFGSEFETTITFVEERPCHKTSINRLRYFHPTTKWTTCYDASYWQNVM